MIIPYLIFFALAFMCVVCLRFSYRLMWDCSQYYADLKYYVGAVVLFGAAIVFFAEAYYRCPFRVVLL